MFANHRNCLFLYVRRAALIQKNKISLRNSATSTGLFGIRGLYAAGDFNKLAINSTKTIDNIRDSMLVNNNLNANQTLLLLDTISNELCSVIDVAELCRNVHEQNEFLESAEKSFEILSGFIHKLNTDQRVYNKLMSLMTTSDIWNNLNYEERTFLKDLRGEFETDGIHLTGDAKKKALELQGKVVAFETAYCQNAANDTQELLLGPFPNPSNIEILKNWLSVQCGIIQRPFLQSATHLICNTDRRVYGSLLRSIVQDHLRKELYISTLNEPRSNVNALGNLVKYRQLLARSLGFESYAHKYLQNKVLNTPEAVATFLKSISKASKTQTLRELQALTQLKHESMRRKSNSHGEKTNDILSKLINPFRDATQPGISPHTQQTSPLHPWDMAYYTSQYQSQALRDEGRKESALHTVQEYLPLDACLDGLRYVSHALFGISLIEEPMAETERWTLRSQRKQNTAADDIKKLVVRDEDGHMIGTVYLDMYMRPGKFTGAAHFTVLCGCKKVEIENSEMAKNGDVLKLKESQQLPIVALVFNITHSHDTSSGSATAAATQQPLLSLHELETLFHEWGHALHSLLSRTRFQHLSGTRGSVDYIEVPSHLMEYFARSPEVISQWARHHVTGERPSVEMLADALSHRGEFRAIELQQQVLFSAADQYLFSKDIGDLSDLSAEEVYDKIRTGLAMLQQEYTDLPVVEDESGQVLPALNLLDHTHFVSYGGGYYAYLFAKMYAAQIWCNLFAANPLSRGAGDRLWKDMLIYGSGKDPKDMLRDLAGGDLDPSYYLNTVLRDEQI